MKSRMLNSIVVVTIFVVLASPAMITAQTEREQHNNQSNNFVKNLDTLEGTPTIVECAATRLPTSLTNTVPTMMTLTLSTHLGIVPSTRARTS